MTHTINFPVQYSSWQIDLSTNPPVTGKLFAGFPFLATGRVTIPAGNVDPENPPNIKLSLRELSDEGQEQSTVFAVTSANFESEVLQRSSSSTS